MGVEQDLPGYWQGEKILVSGLLPASSSVLSPVTTRYDTAAVFSNSDVIENEVCSSLFFLSFTLILSVSSFEVLVFSVCSGLGEEFTLGFSTLDIIGHALL